MAQDGPAQVAKAGHRPGRLPEPHVAVSGSVTGGKVKEGWLKSAPQIIGEPKQINMTYFLEKL